MSTIQGSFEKLISLAIQREEEAYSFYTESAARAELKSSSKLLLELASQEKMHKEKLMTALKGGVCDTFGCTAEDIKRLDLSQYLLEIPLMANATPQEVLIVAMKREDASYNFYRVLSELTTQSSHRSVFETLAKEERFHKERLQKIYDDNIQQWM
ncbi:MAG: ferritin family protein [Candidatus Thorarchaeota archaeon]